MELSSLYLRAKDAKKKQLMEYLESGGWHVDCPCEECQAIYAWRQVPWWKQMAIKLAFWIVC